MFHYWVAYFDEETNNRREEAGILAAQTFEDAAARTVKFYGVENIIEMRLYELEDILTSDEICDMINEGSL